MEEREIGNNSKKRTMTYFTVKQVSGDHDSNFNPSLVIRNICKPQKSEWDRWMSCVIIERKFPFSPAFSTFRRREGNNTLFNLSVVTWHMARTNQLLPFHTSSSFFFILPRKPGFFLLILLKIHTYTQRAKVTLSLNHPQNMHFDGKKKSTLHSKDRNTSLKDRDITGTI